MNIKLDKIITLFNERKNFFNNHPDSYQFVRKVFGEKLPVGAEIEIIVKKGSQQEESTKIVVEEVDKKFVDSFCDILNN